MFESEGEGELDSDDVVPTFASIAPRGGRRGVNRSRLPVVPGLLKDGSTAVVTVSLSELAACRGGISCASEGVGAAAVAAADATESAAGTLDSTFKEGSGRRSSSAPPDSEPR